jgi:hypothetical protein
MGPEGFPGPADAPLGAVGFVGAPLVTPPGALRQNIGGLPLMPAIVNAVSNQYFMTVSCKSKNKSKTGASCSCVP